MESDEIGIRVFLERILEERDKLYNARFEAAEKAVQTALTAAEKATQLALTATEKTAQKVEDVQKEQRETLQKLRDAMNAGAGKSTGFQASWAYVIGIVTVIALLIGAYAALRK